MTTNLHLELIRCLLNQPGIDVNVQGTSGKTALHYAVESNELALIKLLLAKKDINPFIKDNRGKFPLDYARRCEKTEILKTLIDHKYGSDQDSLLHLAAIMNEVNAVRFLIKSGVNVNSKNALLHTPLHLAAGAGHNDVVKILVKEGNAEIDVFDARNQTPMHYAVNNKKLWTVELLFELGADINSVGKNENSTQLSLIHLAVSNSNYDKGDLCLDILKCLINFPNSKINLQDYENKTPLHYAERLKTIEVLLTRKDIDPLVRDDSGRTPFDYAKEEKRVEIIKALISNKYGADKNSLLHLAAERGHIDLVNSILNEKVGKEEIDVNVLNNKNQSPIYLAAEKGHLHIVKLLLKKGANPISAINYGIKSNNSELLKVLLVERNTALLDKTFGINFSTFHALNNKYIKQRKIANKKARKYDNIIFISTLICAIALAATYGNFALAVIIVIFALTLALVISSFTRKYIEKQFQKEMLENDRDGNREREEFYEDALSKVDIKNASKEEVVELS